MQTLATFIAEHVEPDAGQFTEVFEHVLRNHYTPKLKAGVEFWLEGDLTAAKEHAVQLWELFGSGEGTATQEQIDGLGSPSNPRFTRTIH